MGPIYYHLWGGDKCMYTYMNTGRNIDPCVCIDNLWKDIQETANSDWFLWWEILQENETSRTPTFHHIPFGHLNFHAGKCIIYSSELIN